MNIDFGACATFKGENQKPLLTERFVRIGRSRPSITAIAQTAISRDLDAVVLRSFSHPQGTDNRWDAYKKQMGERSDFKYLGQGIALYTSGNEDEDQVVLIHGQGLMTDKGNIQVHFAEKQVGGRGDQFNTDFTYLIDQARDSGNRVLITASRPYKWDDAKALQKVDALETWNGQDSYIKNMDAQEVAENMRRPGVFISGSKCLFDLGRSYVTLQSEIDYNPAAEQVIDAVWRGLSMQDPRAPQGLQGGSLLSKMIDTAAIVEVNLTRNED